MKFNRITVNPQIMTGKPCIRGMRITVKTIVNLILSNHTAEEIIDTYPALEFEDIEQAIAYEAKVQIKNPNRITN